MHRTVQVATALSSSFRFACPTQTELSVHEPLKYAQVAGMVQKGVEGGWKDAELLTSTITTQSGPNPNEAGLLLDLTQGGKNRIALPNGESCVFLDDGDTIVMKTVAVRDGLPTIGFGEVSGRVIANKN